jgi:hypothetical protein
MTSARLSRRREPAFPVPLTTRDRRGVSECQPRAYIALIDFQNPTQDQ